jgi:MFS family permease
MDLHRNMDSSLSAHGQRPLNRQDFKTLTSQPSAARWSFMTSSSRLFAVVVGNRFFPSDIPEWLRQFRPLASSRPGYLARPLGGIIMAHFGDLIGRKRMFTLSILMMAVPTLLIGLLPTYQTLGIGAPLILWDCVSCKGPPLGGSARAWSSSPSMCRPPEWGWPVASSPRV